MSRLRLRRHTRARIVQSLTVNPLRFSSPCGSTGGCGAITRCGCGRIRRRKCPSSAGWRGSFSIPSPILQRFRRSGRAILAQVYLATGSLQLSFQGYAFIIRGAVLSARSRGRYPIGSDVFLFHAFSKEIVLDRSFVSSPRYEPNTERGELSALLSFENLCIKAMNGRRSSTYSSFQYSVERCIKIVCKILLSIRTKHTDLSRIFTEIRNFQSDQTSIHVSRKRERERKGVFWNVEIRSQRES